MTTKNSPFKSSWFHSEVHGGFILDKSRSLNEVSPRKDGSEPFISNDGVFVAQVMLAESKEVTITNNVRNSVIEVNPDTMLLIKTRLGGPVVLSCKSVKSNHAKAAYRVWPCMAVPPGKVALSVKSGQILGLKDDDFVSVCTAKEQYVTAETATVELVADSLDIPKSAHLKRFLQQTLDKRYFLIGQRMMIEYFGKYLWLMVKEVNNDVSVTLGNETFDSSDISGRLAGFSLAENSVKNHEVRQDGSFCESIAPETGMERNISDQNFSVYQFSKHTNILIVENCSTFEGSLGMRNVSDQEALNYFGNVSYEKIGGLRPQIQEMKDFVELPLLKSTLFETSGLSPPTGILLHGQPGTGKSMLVKACVNAIRVRAFLLQGAKILSKYFGDSEQKLHNLFYKAMDEAPSVIVVDEIDAICPLRESSRTDVEKRLVSSFVTLLDSVTSFNKSHSKFVIILATTNRMDALDTSLRRAGRFDCEIELPIPSPGQRIEILGKLLLEFDHNLSTSEIEAVAEKAHGYVGADIAAVCKEAGRRALQKKLGLLKSGDVSKICLSQADLEYGLKRVSPSAMRELIIQVPKVLWSDIGGNEDVKKKLKQAIEWPLKHPDAFERLGIDPPRGVLLYGPPGCSKTLTAKALATESGLNFISIKGPELFSKYVGDSEKAIRRLFGKARSAAPSIIFFDELDALAIERGASSSKGGNVADRVLAALLTEMDGVEQRRDVIVVAATNRPDKIDKALLRPGRIDRIVHVPLPDAKARLDIFRIQFRKVPAIPSMDMEWLVKQTEMYSGAEICAVCREAALAALERNMESSQVNEGDFKIALAAIPPQTTKEVVRMHEEYSKTLQSTIK